MGLKLNLIILLMLAFHVSMGSLLLSSTLRHNQVPQGHHFEEHQYHRQSQFQKRQNSFRSDGSNSGIFYDKKEDDLKNLPFFGNKRQQRLEEPGSWPRWKKRSSKNEVSPTLDIPQKTPELLSKNVASQHMLRTPRNHRTYDVPQIECPQAEDGMDRFACPTPDRMGRYRCIDDHVLCDGFIDCPNAEDEDRQACMFYKTTKAHLDVIADAVLRWARGR